MNILVIDVGTSSMRGILFTPEGKELLEKQCFYNASYMGDGQVEQDPSDWEQALYSIVKFIVEDAKKSDWSIDAVTITAQRSSVIPVDKNMQPLCNAIMWQDKRTNQICKELNEENEKIFSLCGARINTVFSASKMTWIRECCPEIYEKTYKFMVVPDYLNYLMTGNVYTDDTYGSRSLLMNLHTRDWDEQLLDLFRVEPEKLCEVIPSGSICGFIGKNFSRKTGCPEGIPVITAGGDQQCGAIGQGVVRKGALSATVGTGGFLITATDKIPENLEPDVICNTSSIQGQYILESNILTCCSAFDWFRKQFYEDDSYEYINTDVKKTPVGSNGCICIPYFQGRTTPDWNSKAKGTFSNVTLSTTKGDMARSLLESICYEIANGIENMQKYVDVADIYVNGGLTNSEEFNRIQCNVYGKKLIRQGKADATARGALMVATTTLGIYSSVETAYQELKKLEHSKEYYPQKELVMQYRMLRENMNALYKRIYL